ncbi:methyltransferase domain-containing protein [Microbacterium sp.]|uniref:methyltransferase domain-containing protein n=1 Tax=Microbacterium sp. TaxID=51671 RepID=UPI0028A74452|nr:methyltransferase domain-containing protein [Microbacterium sp.]
MKAERARAVDLRRRAVDLPERMDADDADPEMLARTYALFTYVNAILSGRRGLHNREIDPRARHGSIRVLDIGCGGGDIARYVARRLRRDGIRAEVVGADIDPRAVRWASGADDDGLVRWRCASSSQLVAEGEQFDVVLSNHVLHHLSAPQLTGLLDDSVRLTAPGGIAVHGDIARSRTAYAVFDALTRLIAGTLLKGSFIREDGLLSIRRSYTAAELAEVAPPEWRVQRRFPARVLLVHAGHLY